MTTENASWEDMVADYIASVEKGLARLRHPRQKEVLADLRDHLRQRYADLPPDQRTPEHLAAVIEEMGPAKEYAHLLSPSGGTGEGGNSWASARLLLITVLALAAVAVLVGFLVRNHPTAGCYVRAALGINYSAPSFFSRENYGSIQPGMTEDEVRGLIGFPVFRYRWESRKDEDEWLYTTAGFDGARFYTEYFVAFSRTSGRVLRTWKLRSRNPRGHQKHHWVTDFPEYVGDLRLKSLDGTERTLKSTDEQVYLLLLVQSERKPRLPEQLAYRMDFTRKILGQTLIDRVELVPVHLTLTSPPRPEELEKLRSALPQVYLPVEPRLSPPDGWDYCLVYKGGTLYGFPPVYSGLHEDAWRADHRWLLDKLLQ